MSEYIGKVCPYCKGTFAEGDDIVVCSDCEMPHHRDCWVENQGCTTFGCQGTITGISGAETSVTGKEMTYEAPAAQQTTVYCSQCGAPNSQDSSFCGQCGRPMATSQPKNVYVPVVNPAPSTNVYQPQQTPSAYQPQQTPNTTVYQTQQTPSTNTYNRGYQTPANHSYGVYPNSANNSYGGYQGSANNGYASAQSEATEQELTQLVGEKTEYYIPKFREMKSQNKKTSWNWPAFLFTPYWLIYRKMYGYGAIALFVGFLLSMSYSGFMSMVSLGAYIAMGILGNYIYMKHLEKRAQHAKTLDEPYKSQYMASNSGVNTTAAVLTAVGYFLFVMMVSG